MAKKKAGSPDGAPINPDGEYRVALKVVHARGRMKYLPRYIYRMRGDVLAEIPAEKLLAVESV